MRNAEEKFDQILFHFILKILRGNETLTIIKGQNCVVYLEALTPNKINLDLVKT